ncbi:hypothetical protein CTAM01_15959 [Colletotrichum tamarilloi]|uniref:Uncharacterized protein n=1 Tax=Colletotrichum tamarilloi TaxID=1209934 RepID=A0ABQ9QK06_9PEZI|nr:uncharacterized protein CTAM01_15959 [Colletotrichum tamarilloi]KAI3529627.1 hypothetical protein CSPX01_15357 [Colletotrichum filicis]KAK1474211.1 hypothetical protein CTAM01_15959 [Colletotrichum tamarilloi]
MPRKYVIDFQVGDALGFIPAVAYALTQGHVRIFVLTIAVVRGCGHPKFLAGNRNDTS